MKWSGHIQAKRCNHQIHGRQEFQTTEDRKKKKYIFPFFLQTCQVFLVSYICIWQSICYLCKKAKWVWKSRMDDIGTIGTHAYSKARTNSTDSNENWHTGPKAKICVCVRVCDHWSYWADALEEHHMNWEALLYETGHVPSSLFHGNERTVGVWVLRDGRYLWCVYTCVVCLCVFAGPFQFWQPLNSILHSEASVNGRLNTRSAQLFVTEPPRSQLLYPQTTTLVSVIDYRREVFKSVCTCVCVWGRRAPYPAAHTAGSEYLSRLLRPQTQHTPQNGPRCCTRSDGQCSWTLESACPWKYTMIHHWLIIIATYIHMTLWNICILNTETHLISTTGLLLVWEGNLAKIFSCSIKLVDHHKCSPMAPSCLIWWPCHDDLYHREISIVIRYAKWRALKRQNGNFRWFIMSGEITSQLSAVTNWPPKCNILGVGWRCCYFGVLAQKGR